MDAELQSQLFPVVQVIMITVNRGNAFPVCLSGVSHSWLVSDLCADIILHQ